jgi:DNA-binding response OmpR family regulator
MAQILVVDDDPTVREVVVSYLRANQHDVREAPDGETALRLADELAADLVVLDLMLPGIDGLEVCRRLRDVGPVPIIMLTALGAETDRVVGLELGADDYVTKPFSVREMVARVKALLRRVGETTDDSTEEVLHRGTLAIDPSQFAVSRDGVPVELTALEFRLLHYLALHPNRIFTRDQLLDAVWGTERFVTPRSVDVYIRRLREKIEVNPVKPVFLKTKRGAGYLFETVAS